MRQGITTWPKDLLRYVIRLAVTAGGTLLLGIAAMVVSTILQARDGHVQYEDVLYGAVVLLAILSAMQIAMRLDARLRRMAWFGGAPREKEGPHVE